MALAAWDEISTWRRAKRAELIERRRAVPRETRRQVGAVVMDRIRDRVPGFGHAVIGFYWPIKGELDMRDLVAACLTTGAAAALPVVVEKDRPVEFHAWTPSCEMTTGFGNVPIPARCDVLRPTILLVPLVGFDARGYRLGYGSGYYDRTLAALSPRPLTVGVGYEWARLASIHPQPHDVAMDAIATDAGFTWCGGDALGEVPDLASPACLMGEADPAYFGYLGRADLLALLNLLLECERAGARGVAALAGRSTDAEVREALREIAADEARFCAMLSGHIKGLLATPSEEMGAFYGKLIALEDFGAQMDLLDRGQGWVAEKLRDALPKIAQEGLRRDLAEMLAVHERNIERARGLLTTDASSPRAHPRPGF